MLNSVLLRQNPHNVAEWQKRVDLLEGKPREVVNTFTEAVQTIEPKQAVGKLSSLWVNFAKFYENNKQIEDARIIFEKATHVAYLKVIDLENGILNTAVLFVRWRIWPLFGASGWRWS